MNKLRNTFVFQVIMGLILTVAIFCSCVKEDTHPDLNFRPCAQVLFKDSMITRDLSLGIPRADLAYTVNSPVGLKSVKVCLVNKVTTTLIDTVPVKEYTTFTDSKKFDDVYKIVFAGYTVGVAIITRDVRDQVSERVLPITLLNTKLAPSFTWLDQNFNPITQTTPFIIRKYASTVIDNNPTLFARVVSYDGGVAPNYNKSWGVDKLYVIAYYDDGAIDTLRDASKLFSTCSTCDRYKYEFSFLPPWVSSKGANMVRLKLLAEDLRSQQATLSLEVKVYQQRAKPEIIFEEKSVVMAAADISTPPIHVYARSYDTPLKRLVFYAVKSDGTKDSIGDNRNQIEIQDPTYGQGYSSHNQYFTMTNLTANVVALGVKAYNAVGLEGYAEIPLVRVSEVDGVGQRFNQSIYTYETRTERSYVYSLHDNQSYKDGDVCDLPDFVFHCSSTANLYLISPSVNSSSTWIGNKSRKTKYLKVSQEAYLSATAASLDALKANVLNSGEFTISAKYRTPASLTAVVKSISIDGSDIKVVEDATLVDKMPAFWTLAQVSYDPNHIPTFWYTGAASEETAKVGVAYAFVTEDGVVGIINIDEAYAWSPGITTNSIRMGKQRVTFSIKYRR